MQKLREWKPDADLNLAVTDYVAAVSRLPENVSLSEAIDFFLKRHPIGLPAKTVRAVVDEMIASKTKSGKSDVYIKDLDLAPRHVSPTAFQLRISTVTGKQIEEYLRGIKTIGSDENRSRSLAGRTQNNIRRLIKHPVQVCHQARLPAQRP